MTGTGSVTIVLAKVRATRWRTGIGRLHRRVLPGTADQGRLPWPAEQGAPIRRNKSIQAGRGDAALIIGASRKDHASCHL